MHGRVFGESKKSLVVMIALVADYDIYGGKDNRFLGVFTRLRQS